MATSPRAINLALCAPDDLRGRNDKKDVKVSNTQRMQSADVSSFSGDRSIQCSKCPPLLRLSGDDTSITASSVSPFAS